MGLARFFPKGNSLLLEVIGDRIRREGKITFADFMELALYHEEFGYYKSPRERISGHGDFLTSPETHPAFAALIARQLSDMWQRLGNPDRFDIVEMGAGSGSLCRGILTHARAVYPEFFSTIRYRIVESSPISVARQKDLLHAGRARLGRISWYSSLSHLPKRGLAGCFLSNELVDAFPVHRIVKDGGQIREVYVGLDAGELVEVLGEPSSPAIVDYFIWVGIELPEGCQAEVNLRAVEWMKEVSRHLKRGYAITIDYGYPARELYAIERRRGTLLCYYKHTYTEDPYVRVGQQDITAHVDFTALIKAGEEGGLRPLMLCTQREFLLALGLSQYLEDVDQHDLSIVERRANRAALEELIKPDDLGRLKVLVQGKRAEAVSLPGCGAPV